MKRGYKIKDKKILASLKTTLKAMERANTLTTKNIQGIWAGTLITIQKGFKSTGMAFQGMLATMVTAAQRAATIISMALSALSWITFLASIIGVIVAWFKSADAASKAATQYDYLGEKLNTLRHETSEFIEVQNIMNDTIELGAASVEAFGKRLANVSTAEIGKSFGSEFNDLNDRLAAFQAKLEDTADVRIQIKQESHPVVDFGKGVWNSIFGDEEAYQRLKI